MKAQFPLDEGRFTLSINGEWVEVTKSHNDEYVCGASTTSMHVANDDKKTITKKLLQSVLVGLIRNGFKQAAQDVRNIMKGFELSFNY